MKILNPASAAVVSSVPTAKFFGALGVRPTDGVIFGGEGDNGKIATVNPVTGAEFKGDVLEYGGLAGISKGHLVRLDHRIAQSGRVDTQVEHPVAGGRGRPGVQ